MRVIGWLFLLACPLLAQQISSYSARRDLCELPTDMWNGQTCASQGLDMKFLGRPGDQLPNFGGPFGSNVHGQWGGTKWTDPDFGTTWVRGTDAADMPNVSSASGGNNNFWEVGDNGIIYANTGGNQAIKYFDPVNIAVKDSRIQGQGGSTGTLGADTTHFPGGTQGNHGLSWSGLSPYTVIEIASATGSMIVNKAVIDPATDTIRHSVTADNNGFPYQFDGTVCLPAGYDPGWVGTFNVSSDDTTMGWASSTKNSQGTGTDIEIYRVKQGCRHLDTNSWDIKGEWGCSYIEGNLAAGCIGPASAPAMSDDPGICGALPLPCTLVHAGVGAVLIHDANQTNGADFLYFSGPGDGDDGSGTTWEIPTNMVRSCWLLPGCAGHGAKGTQNVFRGGKVIRISYQHPVVGGAINPGTQNFCHQREPGDSTIGFDTDAHGSNNNQNSDDSNPVFFFTTAVPALRTGYPALYWQEIVAVPVDGSCDNPWRVGHNWNTGSEQFFSQSNSIGIVSQTGKFAYVLSDGFQTLGNLNGSATCNQLTATTLWDNDTAFTSGTQVYIKSNGNIWKATNSGTSAHPAASPLTKQRFPTTISSASQSGSTVTLTLSTPLVGGSTATGWQVAEVITIQVSGMSVGGYNGTFDNATVVDTTHVTYTTTAGLAPSTGGTLYNAARDNGIIWINMGVSDCRGDIFIAALQTAHPPAAQTVNLDPSVSNSAACVDVNNPTSGCNKPSPAMNTQAGFSAAQTQIINPTAGSVSLSDIRQYLYANATTRGICHYMPWFLNTGTNNGHFNIGMDESNSAQATVQMNEMQAVGCNIIGIDYYGTHPNKAFNLTVTNTVNSIIASSPSSFPKLALVLDQGALNNSTAATTPVVLQACAPGSGDKSACLIANANNTLDNMAQNYLYKSYYETWNNHPLVMLFIDTSSYPGTNFTTVYTAIQSHIATGNSCGTGCTYTVNPVLIGRNSGDLTQSGLDGAFAWNNPPAFVNSSPSTQFCWNSPACNSFDYYDNFYTIARANSSKLPIGFISKGFDNSNASFAPTKQIISQECGQVVSLTAAKIGSNGYSQSSQLPYVQVVWNDYEEGTEVETGIDPCWTMGATLSNSIVSWTMAKTDNTYATTSTLNRIRIIAVNSTQSLVLVDNIPVATSGSQSIAGLLPPGTWSVYVEAVGNSMIRNVFAPSAQASIIPARSTVQGNLKISGNVKVN